MSRIVIRPRIQIPVLVTVFATFTLLGVTYFTAGRVLAERDWFGIALGCVCLVGGVAGMWRAFRLGVIVDEHGVRVRSLDSRDQVTPWSKVQSVGCEQIDIRAGLPLYAPVIDLGNDAEPLQVRALGTYSLQDAERKAEQLRRFMTGNVRS